MTSDYYPFAAEDKVSLTPSHKSGFVVSALALTGLLLFFFSPLDPWPTEALVAVTVFFIGTSFFLFVVDDDFAGAGVFFF